MSEIGKKYGKLIVIKKLDRKEHQTTVYLCRCDCGNKCIASTSGLTMGSTTSCGCKNKENQSTFMIANDLVDGTRISAIDENRKINKNNHSGYTGVSYDKRRKMWVAQITYQRRNHNLGRFTSKKDAIKAREAAEKEYFGKYRKDKK